jgi:hypothetical protein
MSNELKEIIIRCISDQEFSDSFLNNPEEALSGYDLAEEERSALLARDADALERLGFHKGLAEGALSGAHSQTCHI